MKKESVLNREDAFNARVHYLGGNFMGTEYKNVHREYGVNEADIINQLDPRMIGQEGEFGGLVSKLPSTTTKYFTPRDGAARYESVDVNDLAGSGTQNVMVNEDGRLVVGIAGDVVGPDSSEDGNVAGFNGTDGKLIKDLGFKLEKNDDFGLIEYAADDGCKLKLTYDDVIPFYNDTGVELKAGRVMHLVGGVLIGGQVLATFENADASKWEKIQGTIGFTTCDIQPGEKGFIGVKGQFPHINTNHVASGSQLWVSAISPGGFTDVKPEFPNYAVSIGGCAVSGSDGELLANVTGSYTDTFHEAWDGAIRESFDFRVDATDEVVLGVLQNVDTSRNLTCLFSDGFYTLDTTSSLLGIQLLAGDDDAVVTNYVYIPMTTKVLTVNQTGFPNDEHCKIAVVDCQSASDIEAKGGARGNQNVNDHLKKEDNNGHILHMSEWIRRQFATIDPRDGCEVSLDATAGDGFITMTSGKVSQLHLQTVNSLSMPTAPIMIANDFTTPFREIDNLNEITAFSDGEDWNDFGKIVVWVIANKTGEPDFLLVNVPRKGERDSDKAILDEKNLAHYSIPAEYKSKAVLLGAFAIDTNGGNLLYEDDYQDLRGSIPSNIAGGGGGGVTSYLGLDDTPSTFIGQAGKVPTVNTNEDALEFTDVFATQIATYHKSGSISGQVNIPLNGDGVDGEYFPDLGDSVNISRIELTTKLSSATQGTTIIVSLKEIDKDSGFQYTVGGGTLVNSENMLTTGSALGSLYYRSDFANTNTVYDLSDKMLFCDVNTGFYSLTDISIKVYYNRVSV